MLLYTLLLCYPVIEYVHWRQYQRILQYTQRGVVYHPFILLILGRMIGALNHVLLLYVLGYYSLGHGLYSTSLENGAMVPPEETTIFIGGITSANIGVLFARNVTQSIRLRTTATHRVILYFPPETLYGQPYTRTMVVNRSLRTNSEKLLRHLIDGRVIQQRTDISKLHLVGHSYGAMLCVDLRRTYGVVSFSSTRTQLIDPVPFIWSESLLYNVLTGIVPFSYSPVTSTQTRIMRQYVFSYIIRYAGFHVLAAQTRPDAVVACLEHCGGVLSVYIGSDDDLISCDSITQLLPHYVHIIPNCIHGLIPFTHDFLKVS